MYFSWLFQSIEVRKQDNELENIAISVIWQYTLQDGPYRVFETGSTRLAPPDPHNFIDITAITYETLESWVTGCEDVQALNNRLFEKLAVQKNQPTYSIPAPAPRFPPPAPPL